MLEEKAYLECIEYMHELEYYEENVIKMRKLSSAQHPWTHSNYTGKGVL